MSIVAVVGDVTTTTTLALAAGWPSEVVTRGQTPRDNSGGGWGRPVVVEADPGGGSLAAWLDTPALPSLATAVAQIPRHDGIPDRAAVLESLRSAIQVAGSGTSFVAAPVRSIAAARAVEEAAAALFPAIADAHDMSAIVDAGAASGHLPPPAVLGHAEVIVACHRQAQASARAAAVRLERFADDVVCWSTTEAVVVPVVVGAEPFEPEEVGRFLTARCDATSLRPHHHLADDPLAAAVLAGREGVSARRLQRLPLMRTAAELARRLDEIVADRRRSTHVHTAPVGGGTP